MSIPHTTAKQALADGIAAGRAGATEDDNPHRPPNDNAPMTPQQMALWLAWEVGRTRTAGQPLGEDDEP